MEYHKDQLAFSDSMPYLQASLQVQAAHQWLIRHCARHETGGTIVDAKTWTDRQWLLMTSSQVRRKLVDAVVKAGLAAWVDDSLTLFGYDLTGQQQCQFNRAVGKKGGRPPKDNRSDNRSDNRPDNRPGNPLHTNHTIPDQTTPGEEVEIEIASLSTWVRTGTTDPERTAENRAELVELIRAHGRHQVQATAERIVHATGKKAWPSEIGDALRAKAKESTPPPSERAEVAQARALLAQHGDAACVAALGNGAIPDGPTLLRAINENPKLLGDLVAGLERK